MKTWKCPECGLVEEISEDWPSLQGRLVCIPCRCNMEVQPDLPPVFTPPSEAQPRGAILGIPIEPINMGDDDNGSVERNELGSPMGSTVKGIESVAGAYEERVAEVNRLVDKADDVGLKSEDFDEMVHELASSIASDINNSGIEEQIYFLAKELGIQSTEKQLNELIASYVTRQRKKNKHG